MFAFCRSSIGQSALLLGCVLALTATSVQAQNVADAAVAADAGVPETTPDAGVSPDAAASPDPAASPDAAVSPDAGVNADSGVPAEPAPEPTEPVEPEITLEPGADPETGIRGRIVDAKSGVGIEMALVLIVDREKTRTVVTAENGAYEINVPPGSYTVRSYFDMYHGARLANVRVTRGRFREVNLLLDPVNEVEEVAVEEIEIPYRADTTTAAAQDNLRRESSGIGEGMGSQQMSQSGASDAGSAAKRVVGVTVEGSNLVIRGLGGRYSRVYLNGVPLPGTDPDRPSVDLDLFPTNVIDSLTVSKTFLPNMPADFAGGVLEINTVTFPREFTLQLGLSGELSSETTMRQRLDYQGGSHDFLGFDDGKRSLPSGIGQEPVAVTRSGRYRSLADLEAVAETFPNRWNLRRTTSPPSPSMELTVGDSFDLGSDTRFGYMVSSTYDYNVRRYTGVSRRIGASLNPVTGRQTLYSNYPNVELGTENVQVGAIGTASLDIGIDHSLTVLSMFNRSGSDETSYRQGTDGDAGGADSPVEEWQLQYIGRTLWFNQALGDHRNLFGGRSRLRWNAFLSLSERSEPDRRNILYRLEGPIDARANRWPSGYAGRFYSDLTGTDRGGNASLRFPLWSEAWGTFGGSAVQTSREFGIRRFSYVRQAGGSPDDEVYGALPEDLFSNESLGTITRLDSRESTLRTDGFESAQSTSTGYLMLETPLVGKLSFSGGARFEVYRQRVAAMNPFGMDADAEPLPSADRTDLNVLPGAAFKYELSDTMIVRAAYGMTVGRPQARELAPFIYYDFVRDRNVVGDIDLRTTLIHNGDLRWEWFFDEGQVVAVSAFYKRFERPIEQQIISVDNTSKFSNTPRADTYGGEVELRSGLKHVAQALRNFELGTNLTLIHSQVEIPPELSASVRAGSRRMFGQAPYVFNLSLRFSDPVTKASLGIVYNVVGPRVIDVGTRVGDAILPDIEEQPIHAVDLVASWDVGEHFKLKAKWRNMLFQSRRITQGDVETLRMYPGTFVSLGVEYKY